MSENPKKPSSSINDRVLGDDELAEFLGEYQPPTREEDPNDQVTTEAAGTTRDTVKKTLGKSPEKKK